MVFNLIFLYKYFPFVFSFLVWASPVFMFTAVLLGTILTYGKPNIPDIRKEDNLSNENVFLRHGFRRDGELVKKDKRFDNVKRFLEIRRDVLDKSTKEANSSAINVSDVGRDETLSRENADLANERSRGFQIDNQGSDVEKKSPETVLEKNDKLTDMKQGKSGSLGIQESCEKSLDQPHNKSSEKVDESSPTGSHKKGDDEQEEDDDRTASDRSESVSPGSDRTASDRTESVSPGTSMIDISPVEELHPLLDDDAPLATHMSVEVSDVASEISSNTISESSYDLDTDMETHGEELEVTDIEDNIYADHDDDVKSAVSWTDDDHKNVINLGSSDLERNQLLENLIATRSLRKSMKTMAQRNLIDLDGIDRPNVAHISTARRNPFDLSDDFHFKLPGSAPSIMAPRRSPFELPYDPGEEKHDLMGDDYENVVTLQPKDPPFLRRTETFSAGPSSLGTSRHDYNFRPSYAHQRKLSDLSESKASSEPETESLGSVEELEDTIPVEEDDSREPVVTTIAEHPSEEVGHGSESSEDDDTVESTEAEKKDATPDNINVSLRDVDSYEEEVSRLSETAVAETHMEGDTREANEVVTLEDSSSTSLSEKHENAFNEKEGEQLSHFKPTVESSDAESTSQSEEETHRKEPVYDSSPTSRLSSSSICSDHQVEIVETNLPPVSVERTISATDNESDVSNQITEKDTPAIETDETLVSAHHQSPSENNSSIQSDKELPVSDQSVVACSPVKHKELQDSAKCVNASEAQEVAEEIQHNSNPTASEAVSTQSEILETEATPYRPDPENNISHIGNSDTILTSENPLLEKTGSGPADSEEVPSRNDGETIPEMPIESGTVKDKEPRYKEDEHTDDESGEPEISPQEDNMSHVGNSETILISEKPLLDKNGSGPAVSEEVPSRNAGDTISDMPVESGTVNDKEPRYEEDEHTDDGSGKSEISPQDDNISHVGNSDTELISEKPLLERTGSGPADSEELPSRNAGDTISDMPVESGTVNDKEPRYEEDEHTDDGSGESEISPQEDNISHVGNSDTELVSEKPLLERTGSGPADSEELPSRNAGDTISDMPVESGTVNDKEPRYEEDEHTDDGSGESEISPQEDNISHVGNSDTELVSEKPLLERTGSGPADSEELPSRNAGDTISDMPVESGTVNDKEPRYEEDEHTDDGSGESEISPQEDNISHVGNSDTELVSEKPLLERTGSGPADSEELPSRNAGDGISDMPVESGTVNDKEPRYEEDEHTDDGSGESEISPQEDNISHVGNSDTDLVSEKPLFERTGSGPADSEELPSRNAGNGISDMPVESRTVNDKELRYEEDEHTDDGSGESEISQQGRPGLEAEVKLPVAEEQSLEDVKLASEQVEEVEFKKPPDLSPDETNDSYSEHELLHRSSVPDGSELSRSVQDSHSEQHHEETSDKETLPDSNIDEPKQSSQPKSWLSRFRSA
ncbi:hypothetical protein POM88_004167 [Heracleum sosnowskyi]|uniref:Uncharacterized protein n=1 Tax=Heracleum sosnowskyi TaxID=360622 RepID=A0AAD8JL49_9APIA|nr:hypothetical protein POM88_004167 [Heracleum sosnowskyi]